MRTFLVTDFDGNACLWFSDYAFAVVDVLALVAVDRNHSIRSMTRAVAFSLDSFWSWLQLDWCKYIIKNYFIWKSPKQIVHQEIELNLIGVFTRIQFQRNRRICHKLFAATRHWKCNNNSSLWCVRYTGILALYIAAIESHFGEKLWWTYRSFGINANG